MTHLSFQTSRGRSPVQDGLSAAVQVVKLLLGHRVVYVHGGHAEFPSFGQLIQPGEKRAGGWSARLLCGCMLLSGSNSPVNPSDTLLYDAPDLLEYIWVFLVHPVCQVPSIIKDLTGKKGLGLGLTNLSFRRCIFNSSTMLGCQPSVLTQRSMHHQKSSSDSPFQANTATPGTQHTWHLNLTFSDHFIQQRQEQRLYNTHRTPGECLRLVIKVRQKNRAAPDPAVTSQWKCSTFEDVQPNATLHHRVAKHQRWLSLRLIKHLLSVSRSDSESCQLFEHLPLQKTQMSPFVLVTAANRLLNWLFPALFAAHRPPTAQQPLRSGWSKCYTRSSGTEPREPRESRSEPEDKQRRLKAAAGEQLKEQPTAPYSNRLRDGEKSYSSLGSDVSAAHDLGTGQRFLALRSLPERNQGRHIWKREPGRRTERGSREAEEQKEWDRSYKRTELVPTSEEWWFVLHTDGFSD